ncbi:hypothetical protein THRCLA_02278 [Thraustotheca clavata]|uniref:Uncharacterized protein n=1 Tax=Thraustotheca clavata TaxID=74557 RepID=A0A1W0A5S8_9STRA|nr:hypothetical protein THRCLA_02278 [Thraustotheca clavata]
MTSMRPPFPRPIEARDFDAIIASDKEMYPTDNPLTAQIMAKWFTHYPEFGMIYDGFGCCIIVPVTKSTWEAYIKQEIDESQLANGIFDGTSTIDSKIGLHLYHIEKSQAWTRQFDRMANIVLADIRTILYNINQRRATQLILKPLDVIGFSALAASDAGFNMAKKVFRMVPLYDAQEILYHNIKTQELAIFTTKNQPKSSNEWQIQGEVRLMALKGSSACRNLLFV